MAMQIVAEREVPAERTPLRLVEPVRDIDAEITEASEQSYLRGCREAEEKWRAVVDQKPPRAPASAEMLGLLERISILVGIRVMLALALVMVFSLGWRAMSAPTVPSIAILVLFGALTLGPLTYLAGRKGS